MPRKSSVKTTCLSNVRVIEPLEISREISRGFEISCDVVVQCDVLPLSESSPDTQLCSQVGGYIDGSVKEWGKSSAMDKSSI